MDQKQKRKAVRYQVRLLAQLNLGAKSARAEILDAGFGGVFVRSDLKPALRQLVQIQTAPPGTQPVSFHGMVVHVVSAPNEHGHSPGVGIQFYAVDAQTRAYWDKYVRFLEKSGHASQPALPIPASAELPSGLRRRFLRHAAVLKVPADDLAALVRIHDHDLTAGRMFVPWHEELALGKLVFVHISHPNHTATFLLEAIVDQSLRSANAGGVLVRFVGLTAARKLAFLEFIHAGLDTESDVSEETPSLELGVADLAESELAEYELMDEADLA
jgi:hypothetical protein